MKFAPRRYIPVVIAGTLAVNVVLHPTEEPPHTHQEDQFPRRSRAIYQMQATSTGNVSVTPETAQLLIKTYSPIVKIG